MIGISFLSVVLCAIAEAELKWEPTVVELHPAIGDKEAVAHFKYQNTGDKPVHFKSVQTSCGCTVAKPQKDDVAPGEAGEISATFTIGDRTGFQQKTVMVETDDSAHATTVLTLKANVPEMLQIRPAYIYWKGGEEPKAKTVTVRASKDFPVKELRVTSSNPDFLIKVKRGDALDEFKIDIEPKQTTHAASATLTIQPSNAVKTFYARVQVFNPPAPAQ